jgi:hypothetical protein
VWEEVLRDDLLELLASINMSMEDDIWVCKPGLEGVFSVKSTHVFLDNLLNMQEPIALFVDICSQIYLEEWCPIEGECFLVAIVAR